jgi:two-component system, NtrC family, nitrogen regulation sensor histidine kinase NtrY
MARALRFRLGPRVPAIICVSAFPAALLADRIGWAWALAAGLAAGGIAARLLLGRAPGVLHAIGDALDSLREHDYGVRIDEHGSGSLSPLAARFNALAATLRSERNDVYQKELLLETVLETAPSAMIVCNEQDLVVIANTAARDLLGEGKRLTGSRFGDVLDRCAPEVRKALQGTDEAIFTVERGGETETYLALSRWFELNSRRHRVHLLRPFTRELARKEVEVWKKAIRIISHELANSLAPITSMVHSARALASMPGHTGQLDKALATVEERSASLRTFLEGYARFARLPQPEKKEVPWEEFLAGVRSLYSFSLEGALPALPGFFDRAQLQQVLINLLKNAVEAGSAPDQCAIKISALPEGGAELLVMDRGAGMPEEVRRRALEPFYSTKKRGSGLGLPLCREIVEAHGGRIWVLPRDGGGTAVRCWLPGRA